MFTFSDGKKHKTIMQGSSLSPINLSGRSYPLQPLPQGLEGRAVRVPWNASKFCSEQALRVATLIQAVLSWYSPGLCHSQPKYCPRAAVLLFHTYRSCIWGRLEYFPPRGSPPSFTHCPSRANSLRTEAQERSHISSDRPHHPASAPCLTAEEDR